MSGREAREQLVAAWRAGVAAVHGETLMRRRSRLEGDRWVLELRAGRIEVPLPDRRAGGRLRVLGAGKAAASLARGLEAVLGERIDAGLVVVKHGHSEPLARCRLLEAGHPHPDEHSARAAEQVLRFAGEARADDLHVVLLTGGASALLAGPAGELTLDDELAVSRLLVASGATIQQVNVVRRHLSRIKGGQLARTLAPSSSVTLAISDVLGDDPATIGSGPTVPDPSTHSDALRILARYELADRVPPRVLRHLRAGAAGEVPETPKPGDPAFDRARFAVVAGVDDAIAAAGAAALGAGCRVVGWPGVLDGDVHVAAHAFAARLRALAAASRTGDPPTLLLAGGETTLQVRGGGLGGRCQEFAAVAALQLAGTGGLTVLAAGTDGTDGPTPAAGGFADGATLQRARRAGLDPVARLADNDSHRLLEAAGDLFVTGPTGTNVTDLVLGIVDTADGSPGPGRLP
jgi:glycerate-2-kinase